MKKIGLLFFIVCLGVSTVLTQTVVDFESLVLEPESHWDGSDLSGHFTEFYATFYNNYDSIYSMWDGFAYTNEIDNVTYSYLNQYSSAVGKGADESGNYAVAWVNSDWMNNYTPIPCVAKIDYEFAPETISGMYVSLNAYANLYMAEGDFYANNNHWLKLRINAISTSAKSEITKDIILADYRFNATEDGYKFDTWQYVDLTWIEGADSLTFILLSSDSGDYGLNTPAYFCLDNIGASEPTEVADFVTEVKDYYSIACGDSVSLSALAKGGVQPYYYQWSDELGLDDYNSQTPIANPTETTTWTVTITDALGSEVVNNVTVYVGCVSVAQNVFRHLNVYFNSANNLFVENTNLIDELNVYDMTGKLIYFAMLSDFSIDVDFSGIADGMYIVNIKSNGETISRKIVK